MISKMANTKRFITSSASTCSSKESDVRGKAELYLPRSLCNAINGNQLDEVTLQRTLTRDGRIHCSYSVRWKSEKVDDKASRKSSRRWAIEDMLSKDFYEMTKLDNLRSNQTLPSHRSGDQTFTETISSPTVKARKSCSVSTKSLLSPAALTDSESTQHRFLRPPKVTNRSSQQPAQCSTSTTLASSSFVASEAASIAFATRNYPMYISTSTDNEVLPNESTKTTSQNSSICENQLMVEVVMMEVVNGMLQTVEVGDHICGSTKLSEVIDFFAQSYKRFQNLRNCNNIYVGTYRCSSDVAAKNYKLLDDKLKNAELYDIDDSAGIVRLYALADIH